MAVPQFLTVIEASRVLRIGRTVAYAETRRFRETNGREGIPCVEIGGQIRVPTAELERLAGCPIDQMSIAPRATQSAPVETCTPAMATTNAAAINATLSRRTRKGHHASNAPTLPFAS